MVRTVLHRESKGIILGRSGWVATDRGVFRVGTMGTSYRVTNATTWRELDGEIVALDTKDSVYFSVGGFGTMLWPSLISGTTKQALVAEIISTFPDVTADQAAADVDEFIASCLDYGLIELELA